MATYPSKYGHNFTAYGPYTRASRKFANGHVLRAQTDAIIPGVFYIGYVKVDPFLFKPYVCIVRNVFLFACIEV